MLYIIYIDFEKIDAYIRIYNNTKKQQNRSQGQGSVSWSHNCMYQPQQKSVIVYYIPGKKAVMT